LKILQVVNQELRWVLLAKPVYDKNYNFLEQLFHKSTILSELLKFFTKQCFKCLFDGFRQKNFAGVHGERGGRHGCRRNKGNVQRVGVR
jgi:hypothetical protein